MKNLFLTVLLGCLCACSKNSDNKSKTAIENYLSKHMLDYKSYDPVEFSKIDSAYSTYQKSNYYIAESNKVKAISDSSEAIDRRLLYQTYKDPDLLNKKMVLLNRSIKIQTDLVDGFKSFNPSFIGYKQLHTYRGKNAIGATVLNADTFYLAKDLSSVLYVIKGP